MADFKDIRRAFEKRIADTVGIPSISYEGTDFNPKGLDSWVRVSLAPLEQRAAGIGLNAITKHRGLFMVDCFVDLSKNGGTKAADNLAELVRARFEHGTTIEENGVSVVCRYAERDAGVSDSPWYFVPIRIEWFCFI